MLEAADHDRNSFVTLTYDEQHLPEGSTLRPADLQRFLKRFRKSIAPAKIRYFAVGEYGDQTQRPHYHLALFGYPECAQGGTRNHRAYCCPVCERVQRDWAMGNVDCSSLEVKSAAYIAGYVTKKLTKAGDEKLNGRHPEFARMSLRPGIGAGAADELADALLKYRLDSPEYLPTRLSTGVREYPVGRYIAKRTRSRVDISEEEWKRFLSENEDPQVRALREAAFSNAPVGSKAWAFKQALIDHAHGRIIQYERKFKSKKGSL